MGCIQFIGVKLTFNDPDVHIQQRTKENKNNIFLTGVERTF